MALSALLMMSVAGQPQEAPPVAAQSAPAAELPAGEQKAFDLAQLKIAQCPGERFDFHVGEQTKVGLCSKAGASKDEIAAMLESAIAQLESSNRMQPESRDQIIAQIRAKVAEVRAR